MASPQYDYYMRGVNLDVFRKTMIDPMRDIVDRGGKSWRSFACLLSIDVVGGNSTPYAHWLAFPELMHVASLVIDDIQDKSEFRRGGVTAFVLHFFLSLPSHLLLPQPQSVR